MNTLSKVTEEICYPSMKQLTVRNVYFFLLGSSWYEYLGQEASSNKPTNEKIAENMDHSYYPSTEEGEKGYREIEANPAKLLAALVGMKIGDEFEFDYFVYTRTYYGFSV